MHCQNADWATQFLLHKFNITARDSLVGTDFGKYVKYKRPEKRGGKTFLSGKSWKTTHDPWRGLSRTSFGLDYLKYYSCPEARMGKEEDSKEKMMELNYYDKDDNPRYGWDVYVQRISCYIQHKETVQERSQYQDIDNPYREVKNENDTRKYVPDLHSLDNGNTIIIFENSQSGSIEDTIITARQQWESRWRRLPFYLAYESHDVSNDDRMALECMKIILQDVWKSVAENWESFLDVSNTHVSILEDKIYEQPADESRAPELWANSNMWLKVERLVSIHIAVLKEMQTNLRESLSEPEVEDNWLDASPDDMEKIRDLVQEDLVKPTANLADLMYKSVEIRDSRHSLQLNTSMWRLSWITFIFLPLTFISSFFGMNVDIFKSDPEVKYYFASAVPMMIVVLVGWYFIKHFLARRRQTPYQRGIYEHLFFELATTYPLLWSRSGPNECIRPQNLLDRVKWRLITFWNDSSKTTSAGSTDRDAEYDDLGAWSRLKRTLTRRWTSQIGVVEDVRPSTSTLEEGGAEANVVGEKFESATNIVQVQARTDMLEVPLPQSTFATQEVGSSRPSSAGRVSSKGSSHRNSGVMVEEEAPTWLQQYGTK